MCTSFGSLAFKKGIQNKRLAYKPIMSFGLLGLLLAAKTPLLQTQYGRL